MAFMNDNKRYMCSECGKWFFVWLDIADIDAVDKKLDKEGKTWNDLVCADHDPNLIDRHSPYFIDKVESPLLKYDALSDLCDYKLKYAPKRLLTFKEKKMIINKSHHKTIKRAVKYINFLLNAPSYDEVLDHTMSLDWQNDKEYSKYNGLENKIDEAYDYLQNLISDLDSEWFDEVFSNKNPKNQKSIFERLKEDKDIVWNNKEHRYVENKKDEKND